MTIQTNARSKHYTSRHAQHQSSQPKHPVDYKRVYKRSKWGANESSLFQKGVQAKSKNSTRTGGRRTVFSAVPVKMRLQPTQVHYRTINL